MNVCTKFSIQRIDHRLCLTASMKGKLKLFEHTWPSQSSMPPLTYGSPGTWKTWIVPQQNIYMSQSVAAMTALKLFLNSDAPIKPADPSYRSAVTLWLPALRMQPGVFNGPVTLITIILKTAVTVRSSSNISLHVEWSRTLQNVLSEDSSCVKKKWNTVSTVWQFI